MVGKKYLDDRCCSALYICDLDGYVEKKLLKQQRRHLVECIHNSMISEMCAISFCMEMKLSILHRNSHSVNICAVDFECK